MENMVTKLNVYKEILDQLWFARQRLKSGISEENWKRIEEHIKCVIVKMDNKVFNNNTYEITYALAQLEEVLKLKEEPKKCLEWVTAIQNYLSLHAHHLVVQIHDYLSKLDNEFIQNLGL